MVELIELVRDNEWVRSGALNVTVAEHEAKHDMPARISVVIFAPEGLAIITLASVDNLSWAVSEVKTSVAFESISWPTFVVDRTPSGAYTLVESIINCIANKDTVKR